MTTRTPEHIDPGHAGVWPNGEPQSVRDAYDRLLAEQSSDPRSCSQGSQR